MKIRSVFVCQCGGALRYLIEIDKYECADCESLYAVLNVETSHVMYCEGAR